MLNKDFKIVIFLAGASLLLGGISAALVGKRTVSVERKVSAAVLKVDLSGQESDTSSSKINNLSGVACDNFSRRPLAVMIAEDEEARPLSGISYADLIIEMPVVTGSITRMMAIFVCEDPKEIGSARSARQDFIPLAKGYDAILAHWGGSKFALEVLGKGAIDNLDALPNPFDVFYRKSWISAPHNGFTSIKRMVYGAQNLGYRMTSNFAGYKFTTLQATSKTAAAIKIGYAYPYNIEYKYNPLTNNYYRWRGGSQEIDKLTKTQVAAKNIVVMRAASRQIEGGYNEVNILGFGDAVSYRNGEEIKGKWVKKQAEETLRLYDSDDKEVEFAPGAIWIEIVEPNTTLDYE